MLTILGIAFFVLLFGGMPVAFAMCVSVLFAILFSDLPLNIIPQRMVAQLDSFPLLAVLFFIFAGEVMEKGGISSRLVRFAMALVGHLRGGLAQVCIFASMIFAGCTGASAADASAIGSVIIPAMIKKNYDRAFVASIQAAAGAIGPIIPPSILMIVYASIANVSVAAMFLSGFIPGVAIGICLMILSHFYAKKLGFPKEDRATWKELFRSLADSIFALVVPVIIIGGIILGFFTATEAGAVAAVYALIIAMFVFRELKPSQLPKICVNSAITTSLVMIVVSAAGVFGWILASANMPTIALNFLESISEDRYILVFLIIGFLFVIGLFMEILSASIIIVPVIFPLAAKLGFNDVHFALVMIIAMVVGSITPPVGVTLYLTIGIAKTTLSDTNKYIWPMVGVIMIVLFLCVFFDGVVLFLPRLFLGIK